MCITNCNSQCVHIKPRKEKNAAAVFLCNSSIIHNFPNPFSQFFRGLVFVPSSIKIIPALRWFNDRRSLTCTFIYLFLNLYASLLRGALGGGFNHRGHRTKLSIGIEGYTVPREDRGVVKNQVSLYNCTKTWWMPGKATLVTCHDITSGVTLGPRLVIFSIGWRYDRFFISLMKPMQYSY